MKQGYLLNRVVCTTCRLQWDANMPLFVGNADEAEKIAEKIHTESKIICGSPRLIVAFTNALVSDELVPAEAARTPLVSQNGKI